uniref:C2H2-type domain-containing protein n=1 Tax=Panagrolaimus sp. JU765 TaxID=591449 RepID=A0AC34QSY1_9BILA
MPTIASLAPNNTSLHLDNVKDDENLREISQSPSSMDGLPPILSPAKTPNNTSLHLDNVKDDENLREISQSPSSMDGLPPILSPAKSESSSTTETESLKSSIMTENGNDGDGGDPFDLDKSRLYKNNKKRVQCEKCGHTFCDKGALKIHNSSVHLREMHTCTVPGCNKQFPSKRSRNRHSNNPNMHTETGRRRNCRSIAMTKNNEENQQITPTNLNLLPNPQIFATLQRLLTTNLQLQQQNHQSALDLTQTTPIIQTLNPPPIIGLSSLILSHSQPLQQQQQQPVFNVTDLLRILIAQRQKTAETSF